MALHPLRHLGAHKQDITWLDDDRPSGIPTRGRLGAARREMTHLVIGLIAFAIILFGFWYEVTH